MRPKADMGMMSGELRTLTMERMYNGITRMERSLLKMKRYTKLSGRFLAETRYL